MTSKSWIVKLKPKLTKYIDEGFEEMTLSPYLDEVGWSKGRANSEAKFFLKGRSWTGRNMHEVYDYELEHKKLNEKIKKILKRGQI